MLRKLSKTCMVLAALLLPPTAWADCGELRGDAQSFGDMRKIKIENTTPNIQAAPPLAKLSPLIQLREG